MSSRRYVPPRTGPLLRSRRDEDEQLLDDMFGTDGPDGPGLFDAALIAAGVGLLTWGLVAGTPAAAVLGAAVLLLGLVLPLRAIVRRRSGQRTPGIPLEADDELVARLIVASDALFADQSAGYRMVQPVTHLASLEVATLLQGEAPGGPAQRAYVLERVELLESLVIKLAEQPEALSLDLVGDDPREVEALGRLELDQLPHSSLETLRRLTRGDDAP